MRSSRAEEAVPREEASQGANYVENLHFCHAAMARPSSGQSKQLGADLTNPASEHLAKGHGRHGRKHGDAQGGDRVLALGHGEGGDHSSPKTGHGQLGHDRGAAVHLGVQE